MRSGAGGSFAPDRVSGICFFASKQQLFAANSGACLGQTRFDPLVHRAKLAIDAAFAITRDEIGIGRGNLLARLAESPRRSREIFAAYHFQPHWLGRIIRLFIASRDRSAFAGLDPDQKSEADESCRCCRCNPTVAKTSR